MSISSAARASELGGIETEACPLNRRPRGGHDRGIDPGPPNLPVDQGRLSCGMTRKLAPDAQSHSGSQIMCIRNHVEVGFVDFLP